MNQAQIESNILKEVGEYLNNENPYFSDGVNINFVQIIGENQLLSVHMNAVLALLMLAVQECRQVP